MKKLIQYLKGYVASTVFAPLCKLIEAGFELAVPIVVAIIIDKVIPASAASGSSSGVYLWGGVLLALGVGGFLLSIAGQYMSARSAVGYGTNLRRAMYRHINRFGYVEIDKFGTESLITRLTSDVRQTQQAVNMFMRLVLRAPFILVGAIIMALRIDLKMSLIFIGISLLIALVLYLVMSRSGKLYRVIQTQLDHVTLLVRENLSGTRVVRAFSRQAEENADFEQAAETLAKTSRKAGRISGLLNPMTYVLINAAIILIVWLGGTRVGAETNGLTTGNILALVSYLSQILMALVVFANLLVTFTKASACAKRINEVLETNPSLSFPDCEELQPVAGAPKILFRNVSFDYLSSSELDIENVNIDVLPGQTIGVIGSTGAGKTTFVHLIARFYDIAGGSLEIDGHPIASYPKEQLRRKIGIVPQTAVLFYGTVRDNMRWGNPDATDGEIWHALKLSMAEDFVRNLPDGLDTVILQGGKNFSGGQRQRLTIARAIVKNPEILILDDSSSALDYATDAALRKTLKTQLAGLTVIMVSQRSTSLKNADQILVLEDGRQAGLGTHEELLKSCEVYQEICGSQISAT